MKDEEFPPNTKGQGRIGRDEQDHSSTANRVLSSDITPSPSDKQETPIWLIKPKFVTLVPPPKGKAEIDLQRTISNIDIAALDDIIDGNFREPRYIRIEHLGQGGMGEVSLTLDTLLRREVALKIPLKDIQADKTLLRAFVVEALLTAQLEHPNIVSSYDMVVQNNQVGFVMRRLKGERLSHILKLLAANEDALHAVYGRVRLLTIFQQIVSAIAYAHDRNIIHRDLKPANVMLGLYGEVQVLDWGLALYLGPHGSGVAAQGLKGAKVGQAPYMSPEQHIGRDKSIDCRSDIFSLGALLYELLTLEPLHKSKEGEKTEAYMLRCKETPVIPPSVRSPHRKISENLNQICMKCLEIDPKDRYQSASDLLSDVLRELEGSREREYARRAAEQALKRALELANEYTDRLKQIKVQAEQTKELGKVAKGYDPIEKKRALWHVQDELKKQEHALVVSFHGAEHAFHQTIGIDSSFKKAQQHLLEFYYQRFLREETERGSSKEYFAARVNSYNDSIYNERMKGDGSFELNAHPKGTEATLIELNSVDRVLQAGNHTALGQTPLKQSCPMGSYLISLAAPGRGSIQVPIHIARLEKIKLDVRLPKLGEVLEGFAYIPKGTFSRGGDPKSRYGTETAFVHLDSFAIAEFPVTSQEYIIFLNDIWKKDPELAHSLVPIDNNKGEPVWPGGDTQPYRIPTANNGEKNWDPLFPISSINWTSANAYARWLGKRLGVALRLPSGDEWEKAGRGADHRYFPWGNRWDPGFCKNLQSRSDQPLPEPIGAFPQDTSPYGVRDMAGGVHEWCQNWFSEKDTTRVVRGGSWAGSFAAHRLASYFPYWEQTAHECIGFRLAYSLKDED